jgi:hypothetical protein
VILSLKKISTGAESSGLLPQVLLFFSSEEHPKDLAIPAPPDFIG